MTRRSSRRHGYALLMVLVFVMLFLSLIGIAWRHMASAVRIASVRAVQMQRDEGSIHALGRAIHLLEAGLPPSTPYVCGVTIETSRGPRPFTITFTQDNATTWTVQSVPTPAGETPTPMPVSFVPDPP